ncbi:hypothetical protein ACVINZ_003407 [Mesorhizobium jarvisii]
MLAAESRRHHATEGMADDDRLPDAEAVHQGSEGIGLRRRILIVAGPAPRPAVTRPVEEQHFGAALEQRPKRQHLIPEIGAGAMDEDDRRQLRIGGGWNVDIMDAGAADVGEFANGWIAALDQPRADAGHADQGKDEREKEGERGGDQVHVGRYGGGVG